MADPIHQFVIKPLIPLEIAGLDVSFTNSALWMVIGVVGATSLLSMAVSRQDLVPGRAQVFAESLYEFVAGLIRENTGPKGKQYFTLIFSLFVFVLMGNVLGLFPIPEYGFTYTSHILVTAALALIVFLAVTLFGLFYNGLHFFSLFIPKGVPWPLLILIVPIEILSFLIRPVTLSVRLFANMFAGHLMLKVFAGFSTMLLSMGVGGIVLGLIPMALNIAIYALELLVALLQAYIFATLSAIYLKDTVDLHH